MEEAKEILADGGQRRGAARARGAAATPGHRGVRGDVSRTRSREEPRVSDDPGRPARRHRRDPCRVPAGTRPPSGPATCSGCTSSSRLTKHGLTVEVLEDSDPSDQGGFKEVKFALKGKGAFGTMRFESGVHRVQRVPKTETQGRIHTSTATVAVLPEAEDGGHRHQRVATSRWTRCAPGVPAGRTSTRRRPPSG